MIVNIQSVGDRVIVSDVQESVHFVKYRRGENQVQSSLVVRHILLLIVPSMSPCYLKTYA